MDGGISHPLWLIVTTTMLTTNTTSINTTWIEVKFIRIRKFFIETWKKLVCDASCLLRKQSTNQINRQDILIPSLNVVVLKKNL